VIEFHDAKASRFGVVDRQHNYARILLNDVPIVGTENYQGESPVREVLLVGEILIARNHQIEQRIFRSAEQFAIFQLCSAHLVRGRD
jgi:hypothetical protein